MKELYWNPVERPEGVRAVYSTVHAHGMCVFELREDGCLWSSSKGVYAGLDGDVAHTLVQLNANPLIICSVTDGMLNKSRAAEYLQERGISPNALATAGVQKVRRDLQDMVRRTLTGFVERYFDQLPQDRRA